MHISSSYAKILKETNFRTREIPRRGSKAKDGEKKERKRPNDGNNNGQATHGARKPPGPTKPVSFNCVRKNGTYGKMEPVLVQQIQTKTTSNRPTGAVQVQLVRFKGEQNCPAARFAKINPTLTAGVDYLVWLHRHPNVIRIRVFDKSVQLTNLRWLHSFFSSLYLRDPA